MSADLDPRSGSYTEEQRRQFAAAFRPIAVRYRWKTRLAWLPFAGVAVFVLAGLAATLGDATTLAGVFLAAAAVLLLTGFIIRATAPLRVCPGCKKRLDRGLGIYCPVCAHPAVVGSKWHEMPTCTHCRHQLRRDTGIPLFPVRACTHCGLFLDAEGL